MNRKILVPFVVLISFLALAGALYVNRAGQTPGDAPGANEVNAPLNSEVASAKADKPMEEESAGATYQEDADRSADAPSDSRFGDSTFLHALSASKDISELLNRADSDFLLDDPKVRSEMALIGHFCAGILASEIDADMNGSGNEARKRAESYCSSADLDRFRAEFGSADIHLSVLGEQVESAIQQGNAEQMILDLLEIIARSEYQSEILASALLIAHIQTEAPIAAGRFALRTPLPFEELQFAATSAGQIYFCSLGGGCGKEHIATIMFCAQVRCEPFITTLEGAIRRMNSQRINEATDEYLSLFWKARRQFQ